MPGRATLLWWALGGCAAPSVDPLATPAGAGTPGDDIEDVAVVLRAPRDRAAPDRGYSLHAASMGAGASLSRDLLRDDLPLGVPTPIALPDLGSGVAWWLSARRLDTPEASACDWGADSDDTAETDPPPCYGSFDAEIGLLASDEAAGVPGDVLAPVEETLQVVTLQLVASCMCAY